MVGLGLKESSSLRIFVPPVSQYSEFCGLSQVVFLTSLFVGELGEYVGLVKQNLPFTLRERALHTNFRNTQSVEFGQPDKALGTVAGFRGAIFGCLERTFSDKPQERFFCLCWLFCFLLLFFF